jgi:hypothetical protein
LEVVVPKKVPGEIMFSRSPHTLFSARRTKHAAVDAKRMRVAR